MAVESYEGFTSKDGTGLYHDIFAAAFSKGGVAIETDYFPTNRSVSLVSSGEYDFTGGLPWGEGNFSPLPILDYRIGVIYQKDVITNWTGPESLDGLRLVGPPQASSSFNMDVTEVDSREQAMNLVLRGRADAYIDVGFILDRALNEGVLLNEGGEDYVVTADVSNIAMSTVAGAKLFILFASNERGVALRDIYSDGIRSLNASGELDEIYERYNQVVPAFE